MMKHIAERILIASAKPDAEKAPGPLKPDSEAP